MVKNIIKWVKTPAGIISCTILAATILLVVFNELCFQTKLEDYTSGVVTGFIGIIVTVVFVQFLFDRKNIHDSKAQEGKAIARANRVLQNYLSRYKLLYYCIATPIADRDFKNATMPDAFTLKDMRDLHQPSLLITLSITKPSVDSFLEIELTIRNHMIAMLNNIDFKYYSEIGTILLSFIETSILGDVRGSFFVMPNMFFGKEETAKIIHRMLDEDADELYRKIRAGEEGKGAHLVHPYILLYAMMNDERGLIRQYNEHVSRIGDF